MQELERAFEAREEEDRLVRRVSKVVLAVLLEWERTSDIIRQGLERMEWWERRMQSFYPVTYERLKLSSGRRANAAELVQTSKSDVWRTLQVWLEAEHDKERVAWQLEDQGAVTACHVQDEFGVDRLHFLVRRDTLALRVIGLNRKRPFRRYLKLDDTKLEPVRLWTIPFQEAALIELKNPKTNARELFWINEQQHSSHLEMWNINRNNYPDGEDDFVFPKVMEGDTSLEPSLLVAGTESRLDVANVHVAAACITIRSRDMMFFDQVKQDKPITSWRSLLTLEAPEPKLYGSQVTASCYVLDTFFLYACSDGVLRAHPRSNPRSMYHVLDMHTRILHLTGLYNVVAICHSYHVLEVRQVVARRNEDPFIQVSRVLFEERNVDSAHRPLLYGPYVLYRTLDGQWYRTRYDAPEAIREPLKLPWKAGWEIRSIKNANWRFLTATVVGRRNNEEQEVFYFISQPEALPASSPNTWIACRLIK